MKMYMLYILPALFAIIAQVTSHGYMFTPINRASRWRLDNGNPEIAHNYEDNEFFCGGMNVQHNINKGKCGPCGNDWRDSVPRSNENGGTYGNGVVVESYTPGSIIETAIRITSNHLGKISYQLCKLVDPELPETEECFQPLTLSDGSYYQKIEKNYYNFTSSVKLPDEIVCDRCVLRWQYQAGNNWGDCGGGRWAVGCGPQETFRSCADISILP